jgi:hypothetical protein
MSSTYKSTTGKGSGFKGASSIRNDPNVKVHNCTNLGNIYEDPKHGNGVRVKRGERGVREGGAKAIGCLAAASYVQALSDF